MLDAACHRGVVAGCKTPNAPGASAALSVRPAMII
jgi:hypothetical protein